MSAAAFVPLTQLQTPPPPPPPPPRPRAPRQGGPSSNEVAHPAPPPHPHVQRPANITVVRTPLELQDATLHGVQDIEIRAHLDLTSLDLAQDPTGEFTGIIRAFGRSSLLYSYGSMRSIRGNCSDPNAAAALRLPAADAAGMLPLKPFQCLLRTSEPLLTVNNGKLWLDNVYLLLRRTAVRPRMAFVAAGTARQDEVDPPGLRPSHVFATNVTFHGEARGCAHAYFSDVGNARAFFGDCIFNEWSGTESPVAVYYQAVVNIANSVFRNMRLAVEIADVSYGSTVRFEATRFANVTLTRGRVVSTTKNDYVGAPVYDGLYYYADDDAAYDVEAAEVPLEDRGMWGADYVVAEDMLSDCMFLGARLNESMPGCPPVSVDGRRRKYAGWAWRQSGDDGEDEDELYADWIDHDPTVGIEERLLDENTAWFVEARAILPPPQPAPPQWPPFTVAHPPGGPGDSTLHGFAAAAGAPLTPPFSFMPVAPLLTACAGSGAGRHCGGGGGGVLPGWAAAALLAMLAAAVLAAAAAALAIRRIKRWQARTAYLHAGAISGVSTDTGSSTLLLLSPLPGSATAPPSIELPTATATPLEARLRVLSRQLDRFGQGHLLLGRFQLLGPSERRYGGSTLVQFARDTLDLKEYAIKFFLNTEAFEAEATLYAAHIPYLRSSLSWPLAARASATAAAALATADAAGGPRSPTAAATTPPAPRGATAADQFLPEILTVSDGTVVVPDDPSGHGLPPFLVMARGESLLEWSNRAAPDLFAALSILSSLSLRLANVHASGRVHRNVKPTSVVLMPSTQRWVLCSFAHAARVGDREPLCCTLAYAAPEAVRAFDAGERAIFCSPALDAWALGVLAFELLTAVPAFDMAMIGKEQVLAMLRGDKPLPWEGEGSAAAVAMLGALKEPVLQLLRRDAAQRTSAQHFHETCSRMFATRSTTRGGRTRSATPAAAAARAPSRASTAAQDLSGTTTLWVGDVGDLGVQCGAVTEDSTCPSIG